MSQRSLKQSAALALQCLDLTSLGEADTAADIAALCARAQSAHGPVAAVCVWPRFVAQARAALPAGIKVAAVANFPAGDLDLPQALADVQAILAAGGDEVDVVLPYRALQAGQQQAVSDFLAGVRAACAGKTLKVIIESGELATPELIRLATQLSMAAGADFIKTSTGKSPVSATPAAAEAMLDEIAKAARPGLGFKASGGIRTVRDAETYLALAEQALGAAALQPARLRFGASGLLSDILALLDGQSAGAPGSGY
ncbi:deoxyribose-phosphate aldolase [Paucibacter oligotrophus]|uniref:Deoxyribose-phosphate aldolase n=1 Tax=Roseateles oligotrophus TaxID=1769250 RepID=A0A840LB36_9BURK|nr:deoxyribose-phosphate aldolase [Roseateles oligotrophus]MBB4843923.1 deoxyribose-phosphate aldolase [Roseateles oligotrophus]